MPKITLELLGQVNNKTKQANKSLIPKYVVKITASDLNNLFKYESAGKKHPYKIQPDSTIVLDEIIQRGVNDSGKIRQEETKVKDIRDSLLGVNKLSPRAFIGNLVWNIRRDGTEKLAELVTQYDDGRPPEKKLEIETKKIYLPDSAHRHLGICEAYKESLKSEFEQFDSEFEFVVDVYNLDKNLEKLLFNELNSKQKKITAAKAKELDSTSPIGNLKDSILAFDQANERLFSQNIEVNSNTNDRHTLMTMSVFTASIKAMFGLSTIKECLEDDDLKEELAEYYCNFFYKLREEIEVQCKIRNKIQTIKPFESLYLKYIYPVENKDLEEEEQEQELMDARDEAKQINQRVREQDKTNSNPMIRSLCKIGGHIRQMPNWHEVIERLQTSLMFPANGKYFQADNEELLLTNPETGHSIATLKDDGNLNIQVQTHTLNTIEEHLIEKLSLNEEIQIAIVDTNDNRKQCNMNTGTFSFVPVFSRTDENYIDLEVTFFVGAKVEVTTQSIQLKIEPTVSWKEAKFVGQKKKKAKKVIFHEGYEHEYYGSGIKKVSADFELTFPKYDLDDSDAFKFEFEITYLGLSGDSETQKFALQIQPRQAD